MRNNNEQVELSNQLNNVVNNASVNTVIDVTHKQNTFQLCLTMLLYY